LNIILSQNSHISLIDFKYQKKTKETGKGIVFMYNENENNDLGRTTPEEHKEEPITTNFTMRDPDPEEAARENGYESKETQPEYTRQESRSVYGQQPYTENQSQGMNQSQGVNQSQGMNQAQNQQTYRPAQPMGQNPYQSGQNAYQGSQSGQNAYQGSQNGQSQNAYRSSYGYQQTSQNQQSYGGQQGIPHYQEHQYQRMTQGPVPEGPKPPKKKSGFAKRAAAIVGAALVFGVVAGSTMVGINWAAGSYNQRNQVEISQAETLPSSDGSAAASSDSTSGQVSGMAANMDVSAIVDKAMPSVVAITSKVIYESQTFFGPMQREGVGSGSGIIVGKNDDELLIVTNNHVVQGAEELKVTFIDQTPVDAAIKGTDADSDLAVIAVALKDIPSDTLSQIAIASLGNSDNIKVGQGVVAIGNALGYGQSVTVGYISALDRTVQTEDGVSRDLLQTDAAINPGNSGGALLNMQGEVIGINSAKYSSTEVEGMGYAIPISKAQNIIDTLMTKKTRTQVADTEQGYLGVQIKNIDAATSQQLGMPQGVFIYKIVEGGAASKSDLREKDIITKFDGQSIKTYDDLTNMLKYYEGGTTVTVTVQSLENGQYVERNVDITLDKKPVENSVN
jgi:serine protease Do